ncbi:MAG: hypothetical protein IJA86_04500 [Clostridia bacterium]|nr:hypothetical protein [Clostridia bacterium]
MKRKLVLIIYVILSLSLLFTGCTVSEDSEESRSLCETFLDYTIQNDYHAAYGMVSHVASEENFVPLWNEMRKVLQDSKSYELTQKNWYKKWNNGVTTTEVLFEVVTDNGKTCQVTIYTMDGVEGIARLQFLDSTEFVQKTEFISVVNIFLILFSLLCIAFSVWMLVDCLKRRLNHKILWIILTLFHLGFAITESVSSFNFQLKLYFLFPVSQISTHPSALAVTVAVFFPVGAIIYFFMRKRLTVPEQTKTQTSDEASEQITDETVS